MSTITMPAQPPMARSRWGAEAAIIAILSAGVLAAGAAAATIPFTSMVTAEGVVAPRSAAAGNPKAEHLEGGIVAEILAQEGDHVVGGQVIARMRLLTAVADAGQQQRKLDALRAQVARLTALAEGLDAPDFAGLPDAVVAAERNLFAADRARLAAKVASLEAEIERSLSAARSAEVQAQEQRGLIDTLNGKVAMTSEVAARMGNTGPLTDARAQLAGAKTQLAAFLAQAEAGRDAAKVATAKIAELRADAAADARGQMAKALSDIATLEETLEAARDRVERTEVRAPVTGTIQSLPVYAGKTLAPGGTVAEIVADDSLEISVRARPDEIDGLHAGVPAEIKLSARDYMLHGSVAGSVISVSEDTEKDLRTGASWYKVHIRPVSSEGIAARLKPGLPAQVSLVTGEHTLADFWIGKIASGLSSAFRER